MPCLNAPMPRVRQPAARVMAGAMDLTCILEEHGDPIIIGGAGDLDWVRCRRALGLTHPTPPTSFAHSRRVGVRRWCEISM